MYIRLIDEGYKKTLTIKKNLTAKFVDEYEIIIDNINTAEQMLLILLSYEFLTQTYILLIYSG